MAELTEDELFDLDDDKLEEAFKEAKAEEANSELDDNDITNEEEITDTTKEETVENTENNNSSEDSVNSEEELEQPEEITNEDSDDNSDETEEEESKADEPVKENTENSEDNKDKPTEEETQPKQVHKFKANGLEYEFTDEEIKSQFPKVFGQAMDYTKKMQQIKPWRKTIDAIQEAGLKHDDINFAIDVLKGDKNAIGELLKRTNTDVLDLDTEESNYEPKDYGRDETVIALEDIINDISKDEEYTRTQSVLAKEWDDTSWDVLSKNPENIKALHIDVKNGVYDKVQPIASKLKVYDGGRKSDLDYYLEAGQIYLQQEKTNELKKQEDEKAEALRKAEAERQAELERVQLEKQKAEAAKVNAVKKKKAAPTNNGGVNKPSVNDYLDDSDEEFEKWYKALQEKY